MEPIIQEDFGGVFYFTNPTDKERKYLWNNQEYIFPPESTVPLVIPSEPLENIQEIRKRFAYRMAEERLYEGEKIKAEDGKTILYDYKKAKEIGNGMPPTFDPKILEPWIHECLKPLPIKRAAVKQGKKVDDESNYSDNTKAVGVGGDLGAVFAEKMKNPQTFGQQNG
jgi:hypothetical protein